MGVETPCMWEGICNLHVQVFICIFLGSFSLLFFSLSFFPMPPRLERPCCSNYDFSVLLLRAL